MSEIGGEWKSSHTHPLVVVCSATAIAVSETRINVPSEEKTSEDSIPRSRGWLDFYIVFMLTFSTICLIYGFSASFSAPIGQNFLFFGILGYFPTVPSICLLSRKVTDINDVYKVFSALSYGAGTVCLLNVYYKWNGEGYMTSCFLVFMNSTVFIMFFVSGAVVQCFGIREARLNDKSKLYSKSSNRRTMESKEGKQRGRMDLVSSGLALCNRRSITGKNVDNQSVGGTVRLASGRVDTLGNYSVTTEKNGRNKDSITNTNSNSKDSKSNVSVSGKSSESPRK